MWALKHSEINLGGPGVGNPRDAACCGQGWAAMGYLYDPMGWDLLYMSHGNAML